MTPHRGGLHRGACAALTCLIWSAARPPAAASGVPPAGAPLAGDQGAQLAASCAACHLPTGQAGGIPRLNGLDEAGLIQAMLAYRSGQRASQIMHVVAGALSPQQIAAVAHSLATRPEPPTP